ncbi:8202_t:CDS:2, partial [Gigaspora rosea]
FTEESFRQWMAEWIIFEDLPLKDVLNQYIWTSISVKAYIGIAIYLIDESWSLQQRLLNFVELEGAHSGKNIANKFIKMVEFYKIENKIIGITTDNASNNDTMIDNIEIWAIEQNLNFSDKNHFRCFAHILNLAVQAGLKHLKEEIEQIQNLILKCRSLSQ